MHIDRDVGKEKALPTIDTRYRNAHEKWWRQRIRLWIVISDWSWVARQIIVP